MTTVNVAWVLSKKAALEVFAQTGERPDVIRLKLVDLEPLAVEQRRALLAQAYTPGQEKLRTIDIHGIKSPMTIHPVDLSTKDYPIEFDAEPTIEQVVEAVTQLATIEAELKAEAERVSAEQRARLTKEREDEALVKADLRVFEIAVDLEGAKAYALPSKDARLQSYKDGSIRVIEHKLEDIEKARWVQAHGSDHLKRACAAGYDCQRLYVIERAALEAPGWIVDFNGTGRENRRSCPTMAALEVEAGAAKLAQQIGASDPSVVWLTDEPTNKSKRRDDEDWDDERFEECEAVRMRNYLNSYDLYKIV